MGFGHSKRSVRVLRIHCPVDDQVSAMIAAGRSNDVDLSTSFGAILSVIRGDNPLGDFGSYTSVGEVGLGWELFTPGDAAKPALGRTGVGATSPSAIFTVYIPADAEQEAVDAAIDAIMAAHPWEVPVIELSESRLLTRA